MIYGTPARGVIGAGVKLRRLLCPRVGLPDSDDILRDILAAVERAAAAAR